MGSGFFVVVLLVGVTSQAANQPNLDELAKNPDLFLEVARKHFAWDEPAEPAKLVGPIYFVGTKGLSVYLIESNEGLIVLNTGMPGSGPMIEASIRKLGFQPNRIKVLLAGHAHVDHVGGHAHLKKLSGADIVMIRQEKDLLESGGKLDFHYGSAKAFEFDPVKVDRIINDGDEIKLGNVSITALLTNGHTKGSTTFVMNAADGGKMYTVVFPNGTSVNPGYRVVKETSYQGIGDDFRRTYRILESLKPDIWFGAHNEAYEYDEKLARSETEGVKAWVDPDGYAKWVAIQRQRFETVVQREMGQVQPK